MIQPVNNSMPQAYSMPMAQYAPQYQTAPYYQSPPQNNAVKIDIINPQAGSQAPYSPYAMPQASAYAPYVPNAQYPVPAYATVPMQQPVQQPQPVVIPQPVVVPQPVVNNQPQVINAPQAVLPEPPQAQVVPVNAQPVEAAQVAEPEAPVVAPAAPQIETPASTPVNTDLNKIVSQLNSTNMEEQLTAIETIAETAQSNPTAATQLLDTQIMDALGNIIKKDTTQMQGPTPEQLDLRQKILSGEKLTPEQTETANKISDMEIAERNKQFALYTIAILQKLLSTEVEKAQGTKLELKDLPMINDVVQIAKSDINPMLRASALAALSYIATPENKPLLTTMFEQSKKDPDTNVQAVAAEALNKLSQV